MISIYESIIQTCLLKESKLKKLNPLFFNYGSIASSMWRDITVQAKKDFKVWFDQENDDVYHKQERTIIIPQDQWPHTECKFNCRLHQAGGDWENPVFYFRCQLISGYAGHLVKGQYKRLSRYDRNNGGCFVFIPNKTQGNYSLVPSKKEGEWKASDDETHKDGIDPENNDRDCWKALKAYLTKCVQMEIQHMATFRE
jgi:hypothetical protein